MDYWNFKVFLNENGVDVIGKWLDSLPPRDRAKINVRFSYLKQVKNWSSKHVKKLEGKNLDPIYEIRIRGDVEYRPLGFYGPGDKDFTLVIGARKKSGKKKKASWEPTDAPETAKRRYELIQKDNKHIGDYSGN